MGRDLHKIPVHFIFQVIIKFLINAKMFQILSKLLNPFFSVNLQGSLRIYLVQELKYMPDDVKRDGGQSLLHQSFKNIVFEFDLYVRKPKF